MLGSTWKSSLSTYADSCPPLADPHKLKHFSRRSVNLSRLPERLWKRIFQKHPFSTQKKLREASSRSRDVVEIALTEVPLFNIFRDLATPFGTLAAMTMQGCVRSFDILAPTVTFSDWAIETIIHLKNPFQEIILKAHPFYNWENMMRRRNILPEVKWKEESIYGPRGVDFNRLPRNMTQRIMIKASIFAIVRLARTSNTGRTAALTCLSNSSIMETFASSKIFNYRNTAEARVQSAWKTSLRSLKCLTWLLEFDLATKKYFTGNMKLDDKIFRQYQVASCFYYAHWNKFRERERQNAEKLGYTKRRVVLYSNENF